MKSYFTPQILENDEYTVVKKKNTSDDWLHTTVFLKCLLSLSSKGKECKGANSNWKIPKQRSYFCQIIKDSFFFSSTKMCPELESHDIYLMTSGSSSSKKAPKTQGQRNKMSSALRFFVTSRQRTRTVLTVTHTFIHRLYSVTCNKASLVTHCK